MTKYHPYKIFVGIQTIKIDNEIWFDSYTILKNILNKPIQLSLNKINKQNKHTYCLSNFNYGQRFDMINYDGIKQILDLYKIKNDDFIQWINEIYQKEMT